MDDSGVRSEIVEAAVERLEQLTEMRLPRVVHKWSLDRTDRRHSVVYRLIDRETGTQLFYKVFRERKNDQTDTVDSLRSRLSRTQSLTDRLIAKTANTAISPAPVLVAEPYLRTLVTLGVGGRQVGTSLHRTRLTGRLISLEQARLIGKACALIEHASADIPAPFDLAHLSSQLSRRLTRPEIKRQHANQLRKAILEITEEHLAEASALYVHGDLSLSNIMVSRKGIALIDFTWVSRFRGFDIGLLGYRLESMDRVRRRLVSQVNGALMNGYKTAAGDSYDLSSLHLVNLILLVRGLRSRSAMVTGKSLEALARIMDEGRSAPTHLASANGDDFRWWWEPED